jgi:type II secretory pathway pseudopilin PulG
MLRNDHELGSTARRAFTLIELLLVIGVVVVLIGLLLPGIQRVRESAAQIQCSNNLKQLGLALQSHNDLYGRFPIGDDFGYANPTGKPLTFYTSVLPFIEQHNNSLANGTPIPLFFCPSRRVPLQGGRPHDYGAGHHPDWWHWWSADARGKWSILGGPYIYDPVLGGRIGNAAVSLVQVANADGAANTMLLTHKGVSPQNAGGTPSSHLPNSWTCGVGHWDHKRNPTMFVAESDSQQMECFLGSPHPGAMPALLADGSVRKVRYDLAARFIVSLWAWNDGNALPSEVFE